MAERSMNNVDIDLFFKELAKHKKVYLKVLGKIYTATPHNFGLLMRCMDDDTTFVCNALDIFTNDWEPQVLKGDTIELLYNTEE